MSDQMNPDSSKPAAGKSAKSDEHGSRLEVPPEEGPAQEKPAAPHPDRDSQATREREEEDQRRRRINKREPEM